MMSTHVSDITACLTDCPTYNMSLVGTFPHPLAEPHILAKFISGIPLENTIYEVSAHARGYAVPH